MGVFLRDLRYGVRQLVQRPGFAAVAIGSLALGIGLNVTIFSVVNGVLLRGQALERPEQLVEIYSGLSKDFPQLTSSYPDFQDIEKGADALAGVAGSSYVRGIMSSGGRGALVTGETVTSNYFSLLGIPIALGREFRADENLTPGAALFGLVWAIADTNPAATRPAVNKAAACIFAMSAILRPRQISESC